MVCELQLLTKLISMKNILIFAAIAGIAGAVAIYFVGESVKNDSRRPLLAETGSEDLDIS